jgi:hypothetical protein
MSAGLNIDAPSKAIETRQAVGVNDRYQELGHVYRYFLTWRHAALAGMAAVVYAAASLASGTQNHEIAGWTFIAASPFGVFFWLFDLRTRRLIEDAVDAGAELERQGMPHVSDASNDCRQEMLRLGFYSSLRAKHRCVSHAPTGPTWLDAWLPQSLKEPTKWWHGCCYEKIYGRETDSERDPFRRRPTLRLLTGDVTHAAIVSLAYLGSAALLLIAGLWYRFGWVFSRPPI